MTKLVDFIMENYHQLKSKYQQAFFILEGDINDLDVGRITSISPTFRQIVIKPTRGDKILDVLVTDLHTYYQEPFIQPPIKPDNPNEGKPSDQKAPVANPISNWSS